MVQKVTEVVGFSPKSFAEATKNAVETAAKTVRNIKWFRATEFEGDVHDGKVTSYRTLVRIYFDYED